MPHDFGHFEEDHLGRPYDVRMIRRLLPFVRPYRLMLAASVGLVLMITALDLSLPYVTKIAIDGYIVPAADDGPDPDADRHPTARVRWYRADMTDPAVAETVDRHRDRFDIQGTWAFIRYAELNRLPAEARFALRQKDLSAMVTVTAVFVGIIVLHFVLTFLQMMIMEYTGQMVMHDLRMRLFAHVLDLSVAFFSRNPVGRLVTRVTNDIQNMNELFTSIIVFVFKDCFLLVGISVVLLTINWPLALVSFTVVPLVVAVSLYFSRQARGAFRELQLKIAEINTRLSETLQGIRVIQLFCQEHNNALRFRRLNHENYLAGMRQIHIFAVFMPVIELIGALSIGMVIWFGGGRVITGDLSLGALVAFISYMRMFFRPIRDIAEKYNVMQNAMASAERLFLLLDSRERLSEPAPGLTAVPETVGRIREVRMEDVVFRYVDTEPVLKGVSFVIHAGETVAVVGPTGSGKTSLINLLFRFYDPVSGRVAVNGLDVREWRQAELRSKMALVTQEPFLFSATVRENILQGAADPGDPHMDRLLRLSNCRDLVDSLPDGLDTVLGEGGRSVSSGERQLISIARALARNPELIILDEATSYIDSETEVKIQGAIENLMTGRTCILVAHRLSTARSAQRIIVVHRGRIIESGTHDQLVRRQGFYARMVQLQQS